MGFSWRQALRYVEAKGRVFLRSSWAGAEMLLSGGPRKAPDSGWLILPRLDGIGDFWLWLPLVSSLKQAFPDRKFHLLANALWADLAIATGLFDQVTPLVPQKLLRSPTYRRRLWQCLQASPSGRLFNTTYRRRIAVEDSVAWFYPASVRQAIESHPEALEPSSLRRYLDTRLYRSLWPSPSEQLHEWGLYIHITRAQGLPAPDFGVYAKLFEQEWSKVAPPFHAFIGVLPGASVAYKMLPVSWFGSLLRQIMKKLGLPIVFLGGRSEISYVRQLAFLLEPSEVWDFSGQLSLGESIAILRLASGVIGVDTGLVHVAATWGKPTLVLMGGGHWGRFFPYPSDFPYQPFILHRPMPCYGCGWFCRYSLSRKVPYPCIATLDQAPLESLERWLHAVSARRQE